jgi:hypothetical protein
MKRTILLYLIFISGALRAGTADPALFKGYSNEKKGLHFSYYLGLGVSGNAGTTLPPAPVAPAGIAYIPVQSHDQLSYAIMLGFDIRLFARDRFNVRAGLGVEQMNYSGKVESYNTLAAGSIPMLTQSQGGWDYSVSENFLHLPVSFIYRVSAQNKKYISVRLGLTESLLFSEQASDVPANTFSPYLTTFISAGMIYKIRMTNNGGPAIYLEPEFNYQLLPNPSYPVPDNRRYWSFVLKLRIAHGNSSQ